ncbi:MAG: NeuD/PglB/VioB family sugar acetyltransferase [Oscillospiraceae bacterium]|nr:NeuD/PglB/VioB family sugar acetyltransferase [Oscillospiraceae bacterium]
MKTLLILGTGGQAKAVWDAANSQYDRVIFLSNETVGSSFCGCPAFFSADIDPVDLDVHFDEAIVAIGNNKLRWELTKRLTKQGYALATVIHPTAYVSPGASVALGSCVLANASVNASASIGPACVINTGAVVDRDCVLRNAVSVSPKAALGGGVKVGSFAWICIGACVSHELHIGAGSIVAAGAAVIADVPSDVLVAGVPAEIKKRLPPSDPYGSARA